MATTKATLLGHRSATSFSDLTLSGDLTVNGTTTTLDTAVQNVDKLEIGASSTDYGAKINQASTGNILQLQDGGTDVMVVADGGKVGIGVADPNVELEIKKSSATATLAINAGSANDAQLQFRTGDTNDHTIYIDGSETNDPLKFYDHASNTDMMTLVNGRVGIGNTSPTNELTIGPDTPGADVGNAIELRGSAGDSSLQRFQIYNDGANGKTHFKLGRGGNSPSTFLTIGPTESVFATQVQISGRNYVQTNIANGTNKLKWNTEQTLVVSNNDTTYNASSVAKLVLNTTAGGYNNGAIIHCEGANAYSKGELVFSQGWDSSGNATERMRITSGGQIRILCSNMNANPSSSNGGVMIGNTSSGSEFYGFGSGTETHFVFGNTTGVCGTIQTNNTSTSYNESSDYRLKENVTPLTGAIDRLNQLKPSRYNFIVDPNTTMDGFLAHEVSDYVPEAISGEKDAVDEDGNIKPQGIDKSKLVPLIVASIQELSAKVTALENA